jgi:hypothetical protein
MSADLAVGQQGEGTLKIGGGVVHDHELHAIVVVRRRVAGVQARTTGATGEQKKYTGEVQGFHGGRQYAEDDNATV